MPFFDITFRRTEIFVQSKTINRCTEKKLTRVFQVIPRLNKCHLGNRRRRMSKKTHRHQQIVDEGKYIDTLCVRRRFMLFLFHQGSLGQEMSCFSFRCQNCVSLPTQKVLGKSFLQQGQNGTAWKKDYIPGFNKSNYHSPGIMKVY